MARLSRLKRALCFIQKPLYLLLTILPPLHLVHLQHDFDKRSFCAKLQKK